MYIILRAMNYPQDVINIYILIGQGALLAPYILYNTHLTVSWWKTNS